MRRIRWKPKYTTGIAEVDERNQALVELLNHFAGALGEVEHCQDITELLGRLQETAETSLGDAPQAPESPAAYLARQRAEIRDQVSEGLPLPALGGPACRDCGLCGELDRSMHAWLGAPAAVKADGETSLAAAV